MKVECKFMVKTIVFDFDGLFVPKDTKEEIAKSMYRDGVKSKLILIPLGLMAYYYLRKVRKLDAEGKVVEAEAAAEKSYEWYDKIIRGISPSYITNFAKKYASNFSVNGKRRLLELQERDYKLYLVSGGIQECTEIILKENGVYEVFEGIFCNPLVLDKNGKIERLEKRTSTPSKKVSVLEEDNVDLTNAVAVGHDYWDRGLFLEAYPIALASNSWAPGSAKQIAENEGKIISGFDDLIETIENL